MGDLRHARAGRSFEVARTLLFHYGAATLAEDQGGVPSDKLALTIPNEVVAEEFINSLTIAAGEKGLSALGPHLDLLWESGDAAPFIRAAVRDGVCAALLEQRHREGGRLEHAFQEQLALLALRSLPYSSWNRVRTEHAAGTGSGAGYADILFTSGDCDGGRPLAVVELKALREDSVRAGLAKVARRYEDLAGLGWEEAARRMEDDQLLEVPKIREKLGEAVDQVAKYDVGGTPRRFAAVLVTPDRVLVRSVTGE